MNAPSQYFKFLQAKSAKSRWGKLSEAQRSRVMRRLAKARWAKERAERKNK